MTRTLTLCLLVSMLAAPAAAQQPGIDQATLVTRLGTLLDSLSSAGEFSGVVILARRDTPIFQRAVGLADRATGRPNRIDTAFNLGSINKLFTMAAIRQLAGAGKLDLDSTLARYWPDYPNSEVARRVTIRQLMTMTSGLGGNIFATPPGGHRHDVRSNRDYLPLFVQEPLQFEPGTRRQYSNAGFVVLGLLVERLSGEDYYEYVRKHIYEPAGMTRSGHWPVDSLPPNTATGYTRQSDREDAPPVPLHANTELLPGRGSAAGGGYSTAQDLLRLLAALRAERIPGAYRGGLGVAGGAPGLNAAVDSELPGGYDVIVLANLDPPAAERVAARVRQWLGAPD